MTEWLALGYVASEWIIRATMLVVVPRKRPPSVALSWLAVIFFFPWVGVFLYLLIGDIRLGRRRLALHERAREAVDQRVQQQGDPQRALDAINPEQHDIARLAKQLGSLEPVAGNDARVISGYDEMIDALCADIDNAQHFVHLLYYIFIPDQTGERVCAAIERAADRGVVCRVLADAVGSKPLFRKRAALMRRRGVRVCAALPVSPFRALFARIDLRNHRKLAIIDGRIAYAGSQNIVNADYGKQRYGDWRDITVRMEGPIVPSLQRVFLEDWHADTSEMLDDAQWFPQAEERGEIVIQAAPSGPRAVAGSFRDLAVAIIAEAEERIIITSPYLIPDEQLMLSLRVAVLRGVETHIVIPERPDHWVVAAAGRSFIYDLLESGVHVHFHTDGLLHAKTISVDEAIALVGTANFDIRSFAINFELSLLGYGAAVTRALVAEQRRHLEEHAAPVDLDQWRSRPEWKRVFENIARLFSPLL